MQTEKNEISLIEAANRELAAANQELEAFNYKIAHDLRQPLNTISSLCQAIEMLYGDQLPEECMGYVKGAYNAALRANGLIGALLDFSRLARVEPQRERVDLGAMAHEVAEELKRAEPERQVEFRCADGVTADADPNLMRLVLDHLIGNAWKHTVTRDPACIEFGAREIGGVPAYFVRDNGSGFELSDADKLFAPFQRLPGAEESRGFGIGLATVARIVRRHGGRVWAEGEPDKGACFYFTTSGG